MSRVTHERYLLIKATQKLPTPKGVALEILRLTESDGTTIKDIARVIESDPVLSSQLLRICNSPMAGMSSKVASVTRATILLGFRTVANLALGLSLVSDDRESECPAFDYDAFWSESLARAVAASHLAQHLCGISSDEAFICGLLSQIGRLAFASAYPDRYGDMLKIADGKREDLVLLEVEQFGIDHTALAAEMMADWHFPKLFVFAMCQRHRGEAGQQEGDPHELEFAKLIHLGGTLADILMTSLSDQNVWLRLSTEALELGIGQDKLNESFDEIRDKWRDVGKIFVIPTQDVPTLEQIIDRCRKRRDEINVSI